MSLLISHDQENNLVDKFLKRIWKRKFNKIFEVFIINKLSYKSEI